MGAAGSIDSALQQELQKPVDASDINSMDEAKKEIARIRGLLSEYQLTNANEGGLSDGPQDIALSDLPAKIEETIASGKWPLILDSNENSPAISFLTYQQMLCVEAKKAVAEVSIKKIKTVEEMREEWRQNLSKCLIHKNKVGSTPGFTFWLHMANSAVSFKEQYCTGDDGDFPLVMFDCEEMKKEEVKKKFIKEGEMEPGDILGNEFKMIITSQFQVEDYKEFLENALPLEKLHVLNVKV
mmetsp:Transcript_24695/g.32234  ORF Transcript_24695/g.32234 Transcript_24695/m.32234 type:complete len:241 (+) Transcript_24695:131-853(+)|eukprot:CAMPEP_0117833860 /NCGR_PEP_ID=MMETSP0949-20121206/10568_1 /TAXON_ID=44440 /ORGANISM="Chattonella subsalsa, Strain CCMP2191" /LENGTH=240 /DNA_ID=CAMNT_0005675593 /DNA_START=97 /DNA_END=819 /DNA_ORIENTATION=-